VSLDIRFRFVAVWNEVESQDCNNPEELKECLSPMQALTDKIDFGFVFTKEEPDRLCG
jgi:hypothetical protein